MSSGRAYDSPLRREQAQETQRRIVDATHRLLIARGWAATTMSAVAKEAGVAVQTVYKAFGTKAALVKRVYDVTLAGDDAPIPFADRPEVRAAYTETDPRRFLAAYAHLARQLSDRLMPLLTVLLDGARAGEPELVDFVETIEGERLTGATMWVRRLQELTPLRDGVTAEEARDLVWTYNSGEVWSLLVRRRGWSSDRYEAWMAKAFADATLPPDPLDEPAGAG